MLHESVHNAATDDFAPTRIFAPRRHRLLLRNPIRKTLLLPARTHARMNVHTPVSTRTETIRFCRRGAVGTTGGFTAPDSTGVRVYN